MIRNTTSKSDLEKVLAGYRLTTADILYHLPDHPNLLQQFIWQELDLVPKLPALHKFLDFWRTNLDGSLHSVRVAIPSHGIFSTTELKYYGHEIRLH
jgi:uncharacterized protein Usg